MQPANAESKGWPSLLSGISIRSPAPLVCLVYLEKSGSGLLPVPYKVWTAPITWKCDSLLSSQAERFPPPPGNPPFLPHSGLLHPCPRVLFFVELRALVTLWRWRAGIGHPQVLEVHSMMFKQGNHLTVHFLEHVPIVKQGITVWWLLYIEIYFYFVNVIANTLDITGECFTLWILKLPCNWYFYLLNSLLIHCAQNHE